MKTIQISKSISELVPQEFRELPASLMYRLEKLTSSRKNFYVMAGDSVVGELTIVDVIGKPGVLVERGFSDYLRTSPIVEILEKKERSIEFRTEGGTYLLSW